MPRFVIDLGDIDMSKEAQDKLNHDLQKVALGHIAGLRFEKPFVIRFPPEWLGFILRRDFDSLFGAEKALDRVLDVDVGFSR